MIITFHDCAIFAKVGTINPLRQATPLTGLSCETCYKSGVNLVVKQNNMIDIIGLYSHTPRSLSNTRSRVQNLCPLEATGAPAEPERLEVARRVGKRLRPHQAGSSPLRCLKSFAAYSCLKSQFPFMMQIILDFNFYCMELMGYGKMGCLSEKSPSSNYLTLQAGQITGTQCTST